MLRREGVLLARLTGTALFEGFVRKKAVRFILSYEGRKEGNEHAAYIVNAEKNNCRGGSRRRKGRAIKTQREARLKKNSRAGKKTKNLTWGYLVIEKERI